MHLVRKLLDQLAAGHDFEVPPSMVEAEFQQIWAQLEHEATHEPDPKAAMEEMEKERDDYRKIAERRVFPAVDVNNSSTRREEILLSGEELKIMWKLRRVLAALDQQQAVELLIDRLKKTKSNVEFLMQVQQTSNIKLDDEDN